MRAVPTLTPVGQLGGSYPLTDDFVPPVYDYLSPTGHFKQTEREISAINHRLKAMAALRGICP